MICSQIEPMLRSYAAGQLSPEGVRAIEAHTMQCDSCAEKASQYLLKPEQPTPPENDLMADWFREENVGQV